MKLFYLLATLLISTTAHAVVMDFENYTINDVGSATLTSLSQHGYTVSIQSQSSGKAGFSGWSPNFATNGMVSIDPFGVNPKIRLVQNEGGLFSLTSIDLANIDRHSTIDLTFTGIFEDDETITQTFNIPTVKATSNGFLLYDTFMFDNFIGLKEVSLSGWNTQIPIGFDNISVTQYIPASVSAVPVPASAWLFLSCFSLLVVARKRHQK